MRALFLVPLFALTLSLWSTHVMAAPPEIQLIGVNILDETIVREAIGQPPIIPQDDVIDVWAASALERAVDAYHSRGYTFARGWFKLSTTDLGDKLILFEIDEGRLYQTVFVGAGIIRGFFFQAGVFIPNNTFHKPTLDRVMADLERRYGYTRAYYLVVEPPNLVGNSELGFAAPLRVLKVYTVGQESFGWRFGLSISPQYGLLPNFRGRHGNTMFTNDRIDWEVGVGFPYQRLLFEQAPRFQWVHGHAQFRYRFPPLWFGIAPVINLFIADSVRGRSDLGLQSYQIFETESVVGFEFLLTSTTSLALTGGVDTFIIHTTTPLEEITVAPPESEARLRGLVRLTQRTNFTPDILRSDLRDELVTSLTTRFSSKDEQVWQVISTLQWVFRWGFHDIILRNRAIFLDGNVRFWDDIFLPGRYLRVFFGSDDWTRRAFQTQAAIRFSLNKDFFKIGLFNDLSLYEDRSLGFRRFNIADGFGPSFHFLFFDLVAVDLYYGFGWAFDFLARTDAEFAHNFSLSVSTVY